jgi:hypothetical protein
LKSLPLAYSLCCAYPDVSGPEIFISESNFSFIKEIL